MKTAFFRFLNPPENLSPEFVTEIIMKLSEHYSRIRPAKEYDPGKYQPGDFENRFVVWRFNRDDKIPDKEGEKLVGHGNILYYLEMR